MVENVIEIKSGIKMIFDVTVKINKNVVHAKIIIFGILLHVTVTLVNL